MAKLRVFSGRNIKGKKQKVLVSELVDKGVVTIQNIQFNVSYTRKKQYFLTDAKSAVSAFLDLTSDERKKRYKYLLRHVRKQNGSALWDNVNELNEHLNSGDYYIA